MTGWETTSGITPLMFSCFVFSLGCVWQHFRPTTSATTGRPCMVCLTGTAMWKCPTCCSARWATSWQKSCRKQRMRRNTWSTLSSLCRGESWIWSFFYLVCAHCAVSLLSGQAPALASKKCEGGKKPGYLATVFPFVVCVVNIALSSFHVWGEKPQHLSNQTRKIPTHLQSY